MQGKVDSLISLVEKLKAEIYSIGQEKLSKQLTTAFRCLQSHDLIGLDIIKHSIDEDSSTLTSNPNIEKVKEQILQLASEIKQEYEKGVIPISKAEELFLNLSYNKFFDVLSEVYSDDFWKRDPYYRLNKISQAFSIYSEIINHDPFEGVFKWLEQHRPPMESKISGLLFKFIRNILVHFPFFDNWDEIWVSQELVNWKKPNQSIDKFLKEFAGKPKVQYRFKEKSKQGFTYVTITFPVKYDNERIYLKDIICEEEGAKFSLVMMLRVLNTQIESIKE